MLYNNNGVLFNSKDGLKVSLSGKLVRIYEREIEQIRFTTEDIDNMIALIDGDYNNELTCITDDTDIFIHSYESKHRYVFTKNMVESRLYHQIQETTLDRMGRRFNEYIVEGSISLNIVLERFIRDTLLEIKEKI